jgi:glycosyltransferase involved in cell wall biosynthesis
VLYVRAYWTAFRLARRDKIDLVHLQYVRRPIMDLLCMVWFKCWGFRVAYTAHNVLPHERRAMDRPYFRLLYRLCDLVIVTSRFAYEQMQSDFHVSAAKLAETPIGHTVPAGLCAPDRADARKSLNLEPADRFVVNLGHVREYKGIDTLLKAAALALPSVPRMRLFVGGPCSEAALAEEYRKSIQELGLQSVVRFQAGGLPDEEFLRCMAAADLVVLPYKRASGHSAVMMVAFALGKSVIATRVGGLSEAVVDGVSGSIVPPDDEQALADAMVKALSDSERLEKMGRNARKRFEETYSWDKIAAMTEEAYRRTAGASAGG